MNFKLRTFNQQYPFGMPMPLRSYISESYRYGFNGMENANDIAPGNYTTDFRELDTRLGGRWWSIDPLTALFPWESPYAGFANNPIYYNDPLGLAPNGPKGNNKTIRANTKARKPAQGKLKKVVSKEWVSVVGKLGTRYYSPPIEDRTTQKFFDNDGNLTREQKNITITSPGMMSEPNESRWNENIISFDEDDDVGTLKHKYHSFKHYDDIKKVRFNFTNVPSAVNLDLFSKGLFYSRFYRTNDDREFSVETRNRKQFLIQTELNSRLHLDDGPTSVVLRYNIQVLKKSISWKK